MHNKDKYNKELFKNLILLIKRFRNKPHFLTKYLIDNNALDKKFIEKLNGNSSLLTEETEPYFTDINSMNDYYNKFSEYNPNINTKKDKIEIEIELNNKLSDSIKNERYEEASRIRDYMKKNNYKKY